MKTWIKKEVFNFVDYLISVKHYSKTTEKTYVSNLLEAIKYVKIEKDEEVLFFDLMPYRLHIKERSSKTIYKKLSIFKSFVKYLKKEYKVVLKNDESISVKKSLPKPLAHKYIKEALKKASLTDSLIIHMIYTLGLRISELET